MPFISEEIWQQLPIDKPAESIMVAPFPADLGDWENESAEATYAAVQRCIGGIRNVRAEAGVAPGKP